MATTFLDRLRAPFAWRIVRSGAVWTYSENAITGQRKAFKHSSCHQPIDHDFLREGDKVIDESGVRLVVNIPAVQRPPTGGSGVRILRPGDQGLLTPVIPPAGYTMLGDGIRCHCPREWTDGQGGFWCCRAPSSPTLYRTAGKQILEGSEHYADARDEVAAAVIAKALNGGAR